MINVLVNCKEGNDGQLKVLIIDDCRAIGEKVKELIAKDIMVHVLGQARSVKEALKMFKELNPDAIFLDINLPDGNGMDTLLHLKKLKPTLQVITFSNSSNAIYKKRFLQAGSNYFLDKSNEFEKISGILMQIIDAKKKGNSLWFSN